MSLHDGESSKKKGVALKAVSEDVNDEDLVETMNLLAKNFNKSLKRFKKKPYGGTSYPNVNDKGNNMWKKPVKQEDEEDREEKVSNFVAFTAQSEPPVDDSLPDDSEDEEEMIEEELLQDYKLYTKWTELTTVLTKSEVEKGKLKKEIEKLTKTVMGQDEEIRNYAQLQSLNKGIKMMNSSTNILQEIIKIGNNAGDSTRIGFKKGKPSNQKGRVKFVPVGGNQQSTTVTPTQHLKTRTDRVWYCDYCGKKGHNTPYYYKLYGLKKSKYPSYRTMWVKKA
ncbi:hypothetical protein LIER_10299 [Lithospermum erythrorhizon]|uniref:Gag-pol polyprotein n=1 Tax=Lithospermum erythrorhizon TaxID=34254 RepID=A0AAV3PIN9_LITER